MPSANLSACNPHRESKEKLNTEIANGVKEVRQGGRKEKREGRVRPEAETIKNAGRETQFHMIH